MPRRELTPAEFFTVNITILIVAAILFPVFARHRGSSRSSCLSNLKQMGLGLMQYAQDYDERLPCANLSYAATKNEAYGWADAIRPYTGSTAIYHCPTQNTGFIRAKQQTEPWRRNYTDYWFNRRLSGLSLEKLSLPNRTFMVGDGNDGRDLTNARYSLEHLPSAWLTTPNSPALRHLDGMNFLFGDGHVQYLRPAAIAASPHSGPSFALK